MIQRILGADHKLEVAGDVAAGPRRPPRPGRRPRRRRRRRRARRATARSTRPPTGSPGRRPRWRRSRAGRPTCSPARSAWPTTRSRPPTSCVGSLRSVAFRRIGLGVGQRPALPLPPRARVRRRGDRTRSSGARSSSATSRTRCSWSPPSTPGSATTTTRRPRFEVDARATGEVVGDSAFAIVSNTSPYTYLGQRPLVIAPGRRARRCRSRSRCSARSRSPLILRRGRRPRSRRRA